jgi:hypothetical protein
MFDNLPCKFVRKIKNIPIKITQGKQVIIIPSITTDSRFLMMAQNLYIHNLKSQGREIRLLLFKN